jgi:prepilin-type N-terminal cleavage/methylation domain-containing protein
MTSPWIRRPRAAFSLVELLVAVTLLGVGAAGLALALAGDRRLRDLADSDARAADLARGRIELLVARPCGIDTAGTSIESWGVESWRAIAVRGAWHLTDSLVLRRSKVPLVMEARVACPD